MFPQKWTVSTLSTQLARLQAVFCFHAWKRLKLVWVLARHMALLIHKLPTSLCCLLSLMLRADGEYVQC